MISTLILGFYSHFTAEILPNFGPVYAIVAVYSLHWFSSQFGHLLLGFIVPSYKGYSAGFSLEVFHFV